MRTSSTNSLGLAPVTTLLTLLLTTSAVAAEGTFGYADTVGPNNWNTLPGAALCSEGLKQTPISLLTTQATQQSFTLPSFNYGYTRLRMVNTGTTVEFPYDPGSSVRVNGRDFRLVQFHFHTPSEHTVNGTSYPLELHLVHVDENGRPAVVVGVFVTEGTLPNLTLATAFNNLPKQKGDVKEPSGSFLNAAELLPLDRDVFTYEGSLTTPPCSEGLQWFVMMNPITLSDSQISQYQRLPFLNPSNRPLQPLNGRTVFLRYVGLL